MQAGGAGTDRDGVVRTVMNGEGFFKARTRSPMVIQPLSMTSVSAAISSPPSAASATNNISPPRGFNRPLSDLILVFAVRPH